MIGGNGREHADREALRERLSAYLDGELAPGDAAALERHLAECAECRDELAGLRNVRALLRALPQPELPRSFALPSTTATSAAAPPRAPVAANPLSSTRSRQARGTVPALARAAQWVGGLAACFGLILILATTVLGGNLGHTLSTAAPASGGASAPMHTSSAPQQTATAPAVGRTPGTAAGVGQPTHTASPAGTATNGPASTNTPPHATAAQTAPFPVLPVTGAGLLAGGVVLLGAGSVAARRRQRRAR